MESEPADSVLVIDDDNHIRLSLERSLRRLGYDVRCAANGEEGLQMAIEAPPKVLLTDIRMPGMDGHTLLRRLKTHDLHPAVVVMSAHGTMEDVVDALRNGAVDYLKKPWTASELVAAVGRAAEIAVQKNGHRPNGAGEPIGATAATKIESPSPGFSTTVEPAPISREEQVIASALAQLRQGELTLPAIPTVLIELRNLVAQPEAAIEKVVGLIERDQHCASQVIRLANSVLYVGLPPVGDIKSAVNRVGFRQIESLAETMFAESFYSTTDPRLRPVQERIRKYSIARAISMRALADLAGVETGLDPATAYLAGLMSDAGALFLLGFIGEHERSKDAARPPAPPGRPPSLPADYLAMLRKHHQAAGERLLRSWKMDPVIALIAGSHHADAPPAPPSPYWYLSILGTRLANQIAPGDDVTWFNPDGKAAIDLRLIDRCGAELRIGNSALARVVTRLGRELEAMLETLS